MLFKLYFGLVLGNYKENKKLYILQDIFCVSFEESIKEKNTVK